MRTQIRLLIGGLSLFAVVASAYAGGWAIVTVNDFPDYAVAGKTLGVSFTVRQHGVTLLSGLKPVVLAKTPDHRELKLAVSPTQHEGEYRFDLPLLQPGEWKITIDSGFILYLTGKAATLEDSPKAASAGYVTLSLGVIPADSSQPAISERERGERLFSAKGCTGCHGTGIGPELTGKHLSAEYLKQLLADPAGTLKLQGKAQVGQMPNLNLKTGEIAALSKFLAGR